MSETTKIEWTDSTFNPWIGCTNVSPGCDHCYAEAMDKHRRWGGALHWGTGVPRLRTSAANWRKPIQWDKRPFMTCAVHGWRGEQRELTFASMCLLHRPGDEKCRLAHARRRVFCASLADVFDNEVDPTWRADLFALIQATPNLDWLLLTKRVGNVMKMLPPAWSGIWPQAPSDHFAPPGSMPPNVWLGATVVNQEEADRDIPKLLAIPARVRFLSCEPLLGPLDITDALNGYPERVRSREVVTRDMAIDAGDRSLEGQSFGSDEWRQTAPPLNWVIAGGESGAAARPMNPEWVKSLRDQCAQAGAEFLFKQWGEWAPCTKCDGTGELPSEWPCICGRHEPHGMERLGKKAAGRLLDGREWNGFPA